MEKAYKQLEGCLNQVEITLTKQEREPYYLEAYKKARREIDIKGFRKGRVPINLIKQRFGKSIEFETDQEILTSEFNKLIRDDKLAIIGQPKITNMDYDDDNLVFKVEYELLPEFQLAEYKGLVIDEPVHVVTDEEIEKEIEKICENNGNFEDAEQVDGNSYVVGLKMEEIDKDSKKHIEDAEPEEINIYLKDPKVAPELKRSVLNTKLGDSFEFSHADSGKEFNVTINDIQKLIPVEFTDDMVKDISKGRLETTDEYREELGFSLQERWDQRSLDEMEHQMVESLINAHEFEPPASIVSQVAGAMVEDFLKKNNFLKDFPDFDKEKMKEDMMPSAGKNVRWEIIRNKIIEKEGLEIEDYDIEHLVESEFQKYDTDKDIIRDSIKNSTKIISNLLSKKVMILLLDFAITNEVPYDENNHDHKHDDHGHIDYESITDNNELLEDSEEEK